MQMRPDAEVEMIARDGVSPHGPYILGRLQTRAT